MSYARASERNNISKAETILGVPNKGIDYKGLGINGRTIRKGAQIQMANRHMKRYLTSLIIRQIQIKTMMRYHLIPVRMAKIDNTRNNRYRQGCRERANPLALLVGVQMGAATLEKKKEVLQKVKIQLLYNLAIVVLGIYPKDRRYRFEGYRHPDVYRSIIYSSQTIENAKMSIN